MNQDKHNTHRFLEVPASPLHTPGPWEYHGGYTPTVRKGDTLLCVPSAPADEIGGRHLGELQANARLIAAAPELLDSLREMVAGLLATASLGLNDEEVSRLKRAEAVIAKAEGK